MIVEFEIPLDVPRNFVAGVATYELTAQSMA